MTPLLESVTVRQAAVLAAIGEALLVLYYATILFPSLGSAPLVSNHLLVILGAIVPSLVWSGFFLALYREHSGRANPVSIRAAAWITILFGILLQVAVVIIPGEASMLSWTPLGLVRHTVSWLLRLGWVLLLPRLATAHDRPWTRRIALAMVILSIPSAVEVTYDGTWNNRGMLFWNDYPLEAFWRVVVVPAVRIFYSLSQVLFLWSVWKSPLSQWPSRFAPEESPSAEYP